MRSGNRYSPASSWNVTRTSVTLLIAGLVLTSPLIVDSLIAGPGPARQAIEGTALQIEINQDARGLREMGLWVGPLRLRVDQNANQMSLLWIGDEGGHMSMVMHPEKMYMQYSMDDIEKALGATRAPEAGEAVAERMGTPPRFVPTGGTKTVGAWSASEYRLEGPEDTPDATFWFSEETGADLHLLVEQLVAAVDTLNTPALQRISGGMPDGGLVAQMNEGWDEMNVPPGFPVEIITSEGGTMTTITVISVQQGALDPTDFEPPAGYQKMQIPIRR
jgi:hypothetical protein